MMAEQIVSPVEGYPKLACHMGRYEQSAIYRRFGSLNSQNILYLQAELVHLERRLRRAENEDSASPDGNRSKYSRDWYWLNSYATDEGSDQWEIILNIRHMLKDYNNAIIQQSVMSHLADPGHQDLRCLQEWLVRPGIASYEKDTLHKYTSHITTVVASLLPILSIVVLYCVGSMKARLGLVAFFTFTFAAALSFFTGAKRGEIFIATSTFAAVQVVFISTGNEGGSVGVVNH
ncbi:hypothetical protein ONS96_003103 [Cadophora gregata f. sp. sojae]|nr:hypothetical protein ONS96_003103 [Cadophora gregata f. sp. sojae]